MDEERVAFVQRDFTHKQIEDKLCETEGKDCQDILPFVFAETDIGQVQ